MDNDFSTEVKSDPVQPPTPIRVPDFSFVTTPPGIAMLVNLVLLFLSWVIIVAWSNDVVGSFLIDGTVSFFLWSTVFPFVLLIVVIILMILAVPKRTRRVNFSFSLMICCAFWVFFLLIASSILASKARKYYCPNWKCDTIAAASAFGFLATFGLIVQGLLHFREFRASGEDWRNAGFVVCC